MTLLVWIERDILPTKRRRQCYVHPLIMQHHTNSTKEHIFKKIQMIALHEVTVLFSFYAYKQVSTKYSTAIQYNYVFLPKIVHHRTDRKQIVWISVLKCDAWPWSWILVFEYTLKLLLLSLKSTMLPWFDCWINFINCY